ncbi:piggyBac transposable element-derived protein 4-like [Poecilia reticulata]|uniref:PiggyBac transposable element-derived protein 4-like n=1 Tax=Poecilia reticulata TaxID=8081 RepID=A0A3P9N483_POERE|nr:PREDICTED: piggyBac transposable element-derived protein 4-like [Poecilia reticulata]
MAEKTECRDLTDLEEVLNAGEVQFEESSERNEDCDSEENDESYVESSDDDYDGGEYQPPSRKPRFSSTATKPRVASAQRQRNIPSRRKSNTFWPTPRSKKGLKWASQATPPPSDDDGEMWHSLENPDAQPETPTFCPRHPPGPQIDATQSWSPLSLFKLFFSARSIRTIIKNTNKNAERKLSGGMKFKWSSVGVQDFFILLAIIIFGGLVQVPARSDLWRTKWPFNFPFPRECMTRNRFESIFYCIHLSDIEDDAENEKKRGTPEYDRLFKIKPLYKDIQVACRAAFHPHREICVDERMVASKARIGFRQYMKDKPTKSGYKLFVLADSCSAYTWNFFVYQGKIERVEKEALSVTSVMDLMEFDLLGRGYHLYVDNFYTSPKLFNKLKSHHIAACGTIRQTRVNFPKTTRNTLSRSADRGDMRWLRKDGLLFVKWKDTKEVAMCSTFHKAYSGDTVKRRVREEGKWCVKDITIPDAARDYNKYMGGVDLSDALIQYYTVRSKTMKWYKTFFYHFIDIAVVNSFILFKMLMREKGQPLLGQKKFRELLLEELVGEAKALVQASSPKAGPPKMCMPSHYGYVGVDLRRTCVYCKKAGQLRKTSVYCIKCDVALCCLSSRNCFRDFHYKKKGVVW